MKRGVPDRGDILHVGLDPVLGRERRGKPFVLVLFTVSLPGAGSLTQGVVPCHQVRTLDYEERNIVESLPAEVVEDVLARVRTLLD